MDLNHEALDKALYAFNRHPGDQKSSFIVAIEAYLTEMFKPGDLIVGEAIPQRDYRKELWIDVATATAAHATQGFQPASWADETLKAFDTAFPQEKPHG